MLSLLGNIVYPLITSCKVYYSENYDVIIKLDWIFVKRYWGKFGYSYYIYKNYPKNVVSKIQPILSTYSKMMLNIEIMGY